MIDEIAVTKIIVFMLGMWAIGYGLGNAVSWTMRIRDVA